MKFRSVECCGMGWDGWMDGGFDLEDGDWIVITEREEERRGGFLYMKVWRGWG